VAPPPAPVVRPAPEPNRGNGEARKQGPGLREGRAEERRDRER
jgi:hypothetical protein